MKQIFLSFYFLVFVALPSAFCQAKLNVDSLTIVLNEYPKEDTAKVKMLASLTIEYRKSNPQKAMEYIEVAIRISEQLKNDFWLGKSYSYKSSILYITGDLKEAQSYCQKAISFLEKGNKYPNESADCTMFLGSISISNGDLKAALKYYEAALAIFETTQNVKKQISCIVGIGNCYKKLGDYDNALELYQKGLKKSETFNDKNNFILLYSNIAEIYKAKGNITLALDYSLKTVAIAESLGNLFVLAKEYNNISGVYYKLNDKAETQKYLFKALELHRKLNDKIGIAAAMINIALTYDDVKAVEELTKTTKYCKEINNKYWLAVSLQNLASRLCNLKQYQAAYTHIQQCFEIKNETGNKENFSELYLNNATILIECSDTDLRNFGIEPNDRYEKAKFFLDKVFLLANNTNVRQAMSAWQKLSIIQEKQQKYVEAYESYKQYIVLKDSISGDDVKKQITRKEIQYEFDKKETVLKYEQQLTTEQLEKEKLLTFQQRQTLTLKEKDLALSNKEKDLTHLAFLKEQSEKQEKEQALLLAQKDKDLAGVQILSLIKEKALQLQEIARKNVTIGFLGASVLTILLAGALFYLWQKKRQAEADAARKAELQTAFTQQLFAETEAERARIARDLHDGISHELLGLKRTSLTSNSDASQKIDSVIESIRQISRNLHPVMLDSIGLQLSIETFCEQFAEGHNLFVNYEINYSNELDKNTELQILRIIQEALTNTAKHANAQAANVSLSDYGNRVLLKIQDNGKGFDVEKALNSGKAFGIQSIIERAKIINTKANISSTPKGTIIELKIS